MLALEWCTGMMLCRFRIRVMGVTGDVFNEGYKYMMHPIQLIDEATGEWVQVQCRLD